MLNVETVKYGRSDTHDTVKYAVRILTNFCSADHAGRLKH